MVKPAQVSDEKLKKIFVYKRGESQDIPPEDKKKFLWLSGMIGAMIQMF